MGLKSAKVLLPLEAVAPLLQLEGLLIILAAALASYIFYKSLLRNVSRERHSSIQAQIRSIFFYGIGLLIFSGLYWVLERTAEESQPMERIAAYAGLLTLIVGGAVLIKSCRLILLEYLFRLHMKVGVPILIVNIFTFGLSVLYGGWVVATVFGVQIAPLIATSAIISAMLGLALQDTLGNVIAGMSMQFDSSYEIGDWVEIQTGVQKIAGQVHEVTWRATILIGWADELLTIPNRVVAQSQVSNYTRRKQPVLKRSIFCVPFDSNIDKVSEVMKSSALECSDVLRDPAPLVLITEVAEQWIPVKLVFFTADFGRQHLVADEVNRKILRNLARGGFRGVSHKIQMDEDRRSL